METSGRFITIHGIDGTGKSTAVKEVVSRLNDAGVPCVEFDQIKSGIENPFSSVLESPALDRQAELFATLGSKAIQAQAISDALAEGTWVVKDRWVIDVLADRAHQGIEVPRRTGILLPDVSVVLICDDQTRMDRINDRGNPTEQDTVPKVPGTRAHFFENFLINRVGGLARRSFIVDTTYSTPYAVATTITSRI